MSDTARSEGSQAQLERIDRLIKEALEIIPGSYKRARMGAKEDDLRPRSLAPHDPS